MAVNHVLVTGSDFHRDNVSWQFGGKGKFAGGAKGAVLGHKDGAAAGHTFEYPEQSSAAPKLRVGSHLD